MFTGLIEETGVIKGTRRTSRGLELHISSVNIAADVQVGDSIAVSGVCLTVTRREKRSLFFDVVRETLGKTTLARARINEEVNLERALRLDSRLGGHFVYGHVDGIGRIRRISPERMTVKVPPELEIFLKAGSSMAIDGISLTVQECRLPEADFAIIPHTYRNTALRTKNPGSWVNIEVDFILKQVITLTRERES